MKDVTTNMYCAFLIHSSGGAELIKTMRMKGTDHGAWLFLLLGRVRFFLDQRRNTLFIFSYPHICTLPGS